MSDDAVEDTRPSVSDMALRRAVRIASLNDEERVKGLARAGLGSRGGGCPEPKATTDRILRSVPGTEVILGVEALG